MKKFLIPLPPLVLAFSMGVAIEEKEGKEAPAVEVDLVGVLETGIMAIGGETTGNQLTTDDGTTYELSVRLKQLRNLEEMSGKRVRVKGTLTVRHGVERRNVKTISVSSIELAKNATTGPSSQPAKKSSKTPTK